MRWETFSLFLRGSLVRRRSPRLRRALGLGSKGGLRSSQLCKPACSAGPDSASIRRFNVNRYNLILQGNRKAGLPQRDVGFLSSAAGGQTDAVVGVAGWEASRTAILRPTQTSQPGDSHSRRFAFIRGKKLLLFSSCTYRRDFALALAI